MVYKREIQSKLEKYLLFFPITGLIGPRQVGKTTLVKSLSRSFDQPLYLDLESSRDRAKLSDPRLFLKEYTNRLVILDEIQFVPHLFSELRGIIDEDRRPGRFLILGSAYPQLMQQSAESLAGRIGYLELTPFRLTEINSQEQQKLWLRGGFPDSFMAPNEELSFDWRKNFIRTYIERDLPGMGLQVEAIVLEKFWRMLASFHGNVWNSENFSRSLGLTGKTVNRYLDFMQQAFIVNRLLPYSTNVKKRLVKSPKIYIRDSGLLHALQDIVSVEALTGNILLGGSWEGHVIEQVQRKCGDQFQYFFYRTHQGTECDLVLVRSGKVEAAIEIKYSSAPSLNKGLRLAMEDLQAKKGWIIIPEGDRFPLSANVTVVSLRDFLTMDIQSIIHNKQ